MVFWEYGGFKGIRDSQIRSLRSSFKNFSGKHLYSYQFAFPNPATCGVCKFNGLSFGI